MKFLVALILAVTLSCASHNTQLWEALDATLQHLPPVVSTQGAGSLVSAAESRDERALLSAWLAARPLAEADIQRRLNAGEISNGVADSLRERLRQLDAAIARLTQ